MVHLYSQLTDLLSDWLTSFTLLEEGALLRVGVERERPALWFGQRLGGEAVHLCRHGNG